MPSSSHAKRVEKQRFTPALPENITDYLLTEFEHYARQQGLDLQISPAVTASKKNMFREMIARSVYDITGNMHGHYSDNSLSNGFEALFASDKKDANWFKTVLSHLWEYTKGYVQTPHPTEMLSVPVIDAESELHAVLEDCSEIFSKKNGGGGHLSAEHHEKVLKVMVMLYDRLNPMDESLKISQEMVRSTKFSERMYDAMPIAVKSILDAAGSLAPKGPLPLEQLQKFYFLMQPQTWSPGDRDSKPDMTAQQLATGIALNKFAMTQQYVRSLIKLGDALENTTQRHEDRTAIRQELMELTFKMLLTAEEARKEYNGLKENKANGIADNDAAPLTRDNLIERFECIKQLHEGGSTYVDRFIAEFDQLKRNAALMPYHNRTELLEAFEQLRQDMHDGNIHIDHPLAKGLPYIDGILVQMANFGMSALQAQIRQNGGDMHAPVIETIQKLLQEKDIIEPRPPHDADTTDYLLDSLLSVELRGQRIRAALHKEMDRIEWLDPKKRSKTEQDFYETLKGFQVAAEHPEAIPHYLIAECASREQILEAFFMLKAMEPEDKKPRAKVEIIPLVEHPKDAPHMASMLKQAFKNKHFAEHHLHLTDKDDPALWIYDPQVSRKSEFRQDRHAQAERMQLMRDHGAGDYRRLTVKDVKLRHAIGYGAKPSSEWNAAEQEEANKDAARPIEAAKLAMGAGSDITKSGGSAAAALMQRTMEETREALLTLDKPVLLIDYIGCGGGIHRSQPVTTALETVQGRSMRQSPESIAVKTVNMLARYITKTMAAVGSAVPLQKRGDTLTAMLNLSNMAGLPSSQEDWDKFTKDRVWASIKKYESLYKSREFAEMLAYSADQFAKLVSYAARPTGRAGSKADINAFPPSIDVEKLRAIGYGAALNSSGSCVSLYYGASQLLGAEETGLLKDKQELVAHYIKDPKLQDAINRAAYGIVMADMDSAWKFLGCERSYNAEGQVTITLPNRASATTAELAAKTGALSREELACKALALADQEYERVSRGLLILYRAMNKKPERSMVGQDYGPMLLEELPQALHTQLLLSRKHIDPERHKMAELFRAIVNDPQKLPEKGARDIYYSMGTTMECFEHLPTAYKRHEWAQHVQTVQQQLAA